MLKLLLEQPEYFVIAWDSPVKTKRHEQYSDYKAHRKKLEDEFRQQIPQVLALVEELGIPNIVAPWYEADDTIATLVKAHQGNSDLLIQVFSSDKDLKQFLCENVGITDSSKNQMTRLGDFEREFGFAPSSIVDYLALLGDSADNIKGVAWIGEKKASELIKTYGTIENIYAHIDEIRPDIKDKLLAGKADAFFSKGLILLMEVPDLKDQPLDTLKLQIDFSHWEQILFQKWGFKGLQKTFDELKKKQTQPQQLGLF